MTMTIGKLARAGDVGVETVRYYQRRGLMAKPERSGGAAGAGIRRYGQGDVRRLSFIRAAQAAGFTLDEIGELLRLDATDDRDRARKLARDRIVELDRRISELRSARDALARLADECGNNSIGPCPILRAFEQPARSLG